MRIEYGGFLAAKKAGCVADATERCRLWYAARLHHQKSREHDARDRLVHRAISQRRKRALGSHVVGADERAWCRTARADAEVLVGGALRP